MARLTIEKGLLQNSSNKNEMDFSNSPAILACWNSEESQREFAAWQAEQAHHTPSKEKQSVPDGGTLCCTYCYRSWIFQGASAGRTLFLFHHGWVYVKTHHRNSL